MIDFGYYNADCMDIMKDLPDKSIDLAIVDPPYGINVGSAAMGAGGIAPHRNRSAARSRSAKERPSPMDGFPNDIVTGGGGKTRFNPSGGGLSVPPQNLSRVR